MSLDVQAPAEPGGRTPAGSRPVRVVAVLVVHDGAEWLPRTLGALACSDHRPDVVVAVDAGSRDRSPVLLDTAVGTAPAHVVDAVVTGESRDGFGTSVGRGLAAADRLLAESADERPGPVEEWVWLLHDDSAPEPGTLGELLTVAVASPTLAVAGCKQVGWDDPRTLVEVGATVTSGGRRVTDVGEGDIDQGQHDARDDVLLVSTAGMLVRRSVLDHVGGFDPAIPLVGDDVDLCMRVRRAGHRVAVVPTAALRHAAALQHGARPADALHGRLARRLGTPAPRAGGRRGGLDSARRRHWLHSRLVQAPALLLPLLWLWVVLVAPLRALVWLVRGRPGHAWAELDAVARLVARCWRVLSSRWRSRRSRVLPVSALRPLQRSRAQVLREDLDAWRARRSVRREQDRADGDDDEVPLEAVESGPVDDDLIDLDLGASGPARRLFGHPLTYLLPTTAVLGALPALRELLRPPVLGPDGLVVVDADPTAGLDAAELWARASTGWRDVGLGTLGAADPATAVWAALTAVTSVLTRGSLLGPLGDARTAVLLLAPLLSLLVAYPALRRLLPSRGAAAVGAAVWALLPVSGLLGSVHAGDVLVHALLPLLPLTVLGCLGGRVVRSLAATALLTVVVVALSPATWPVLVVLAVLVGVVCGSRAQASWRACLPLVGVALPALVWAPWLTAVRGDARVLLLDPASVDRTLVEAPTAAGLVGAATRAPAVLQEAVASPASLAADPVPVLTAAVLVLLALGVLAGLALAARSVARAGVPVAWCALLGAVTAGVVGVAAVVVARAVGAQPSVPASAAALGLAVTACLLVREELERRGPAGRGGRIRRGSGRPGGAESSGRTSAGVLTVLAGALLPTSLLLTALAVGLLVPPAAAPDGLPSPALVGSASPQATRTLLLQQAPPQGAATAGAGLAADPADPVADPAAADDPGEPAAAGDTATDPATATGPAPATGPVATTATPGTVVGREGVVVWELAGGQPGPGQASVATDLDRGPLPSRVGEKRLADVVASALGDGSVPGDRVAAALAELGVGWLVVSDAPAVDTALAQRAGLVRTGLDRGRTTWRVDSVEAGAGPVPARAHVVGPAGEDLGPADLQGGTAPLPDGGPGRVLVLAENARNGWSARLDDARLTPTTVDGWAQGFLLPADAGRIEVRPPRQAAGAGSLALGTLVVLGLALLWPGGRRRGDGDAGGGPGVPGARSGASRVPLARSVAGAGRAATALVATALAVLLLGLATGVGVSPGRVQVDRWVAQALEGTGAATVAARHVPGLPVEPDPVDLAPVVALAAAGTVQTCPVPGAEDQPVAGLAGDGERGATVRATTLRLAREGDARGLQLTACPSTASSSWVALGGTGVGERPRLVLANPGETGAVVDVRLGGSDGPVATPSSTGVLVAPGEQTEVALDALAPGLPAVLAEVVARAGTVAVLGDETGLAGLVPQGTDSLPAQTTPGRELVLPGVQVPDGGGSARLLVGSVGEAPAVVQVRAVPLDGEPVTDAQVSSPAVAPAGGLVDVDLSGLRAGTWSVHLTSDAPVVAAASWLQEGAGGPAAGVSAVPADRAWVQAVPADQPWSAPVQVPLGALAAEPGALTGTVLTLVAGPDDGARARVELLDETGEQLTSRPVEVPPGGAPVDVPLAELVEGLDVGAAGAGSLLVTSAAGVHLGLRTGVDDADGPLLGATTLPVAEPPAPLVRLVRR